MRMATNKKALPHGDDVSFDPLRDWPPSGLGVGPRDLSRLSILATFVGVYSSFDFLQFPHEEEEAMRTHRKI